MFISSTALLSILLLPVVFSGVYNSSSNSCYYVTEQPAASSANVFYVPAGEPIGIDREDFDLLYKMGWPVTTPNISSGYGERNSSCEKCSGYHAGLDFTPGRGTPVLAAMNGVVETVDYWGGYGYYVVIKHDLHNEVWHTVYAHMQKNSIPAEIVVGTDVRIGDVIGSVGSTGLSTGPHLHFEIRVDGIKVNPLPILQKYIPEDN
jgi:murein DD-endopeptidase MepM/ murein hydrolase activator NlpD